MLKILQYAFSVKKNNKRINGKCHTFPSLMTPYRDYHNSAVSPVVGVMLMLAITVMIAAIVSAAAGGLAAEEKKAPGATLDVSIYSSKYYGTCSVPSLVIKHTSGNVLATKDLQLVLYYRTPSGTIIKGNLSGQYAVSGDDDWSGFTSAEYSGVLFISDENRYGTDTLQHSAGGNDNWFGNASATLRPGDILVTPAQYCDDPADQHNPGMQFLFPGVDFNDEFPAGSVVSVKIIHTPSGQLIFDRDVVIE